MNWKWPNANNLSFYEKLVNSPEILVGALMIDIISEPIKTIATLEFRYRIGLVKEFDSIRFQLSLIYKRRSDSTSVRSIYLGELMEVDLAYALAELHAAQNFVNPQLS